MKERFNLLGQETFQSMFTFLLFCGVGLLISIPPAQRMADSGFFFSLPELPIYFYIHVVFLGILGVNLGTIAAGKRPANRIFILLGGQILCAQTLTLSYLLFARALYPADGGGVCLFVFYTTLIGSLCAYFAYLIERPWKGKATRSFTIKYLTFFVYYLAPLVFWPIMSPLGKLPVLLEQRHAAELTIVFAIPTGMVIAVLLLLTKQLQGETHDQTVDRLTSD